MRTQAALRLGVLLLGVPAPRPFFGAAAIESALSFLPEGLFTREELDLIRVSVARVRERAICLPQYGRHGGAHRTADRPMGSVLVVPPEFRRVRVTHGFREHIDASISLPFPLDSRLRASSLPEDLQCAISRAVSLGPSLARSRRELLHFHKGLADTLRPLSVRLNALMPATVARVSAGINTVYIAVCSDALQWLHRDLVRRLVFGFPVVGNISDSGVYRPIPPVSTLLHRGRYDFFIETAPSWNARLHQRLLSRASLSGPSREADTAVARRTDVEVSKGLVVGPYSSPKALHDAMRRLFPHLPPRDVLPRIMNRFGVSQKGSIRAIDDGRSNGANLATRMFETISTPHFVYVAVAARAAYVAATSRGLPPPGITTTLLDLAAAYRTIPTSQPWFTTFGIYHPTRERPEYYWLPGHNFGLVSAVVNFNLYPEFAVICMRALFSVAVEHYFDDLIAPDLSHGDTSAREVVEDFFLMLGTGAPRAPWAPMSSPEIDPSKTKPTNTTNVVLGVIADTEGATHHTPHVMFRVDPSRVDSILQEFRSAFAVGILTPHQASSLRGRIFFALSAAWAMVGRAATLPLVQRQYRDVSHAFLEGSELHHSFLFFEALLPSLPALAMPLAPNDTPPLIVYTDAAFYLAKRRRDECASERSRLRGGLGGVVIDPTTRQVVSAMADPPWELLLSSWRRDRKTYIAELEALAAVSIYSTFPDLFTGRKVLHWIDNTVALSAMVHGYSGKRDLAKTVNVFYLQALSLRASVYFDYVPSKANIADLPSRGAVAQLAAELTGFRGAWRSPVPMVVPSVDSWRAPLSSWVSPSQRARRASMPV